MRHLFWWINSCTLLIFSSILFVVFFSLSQKFVLEFENHLHVCASHKASSTNAVCNMLCFIICFTKLETKLVTDALRSWICHFSESQNTLFISSLVSHIWWTQEIYMRHANYESVVCHQLVGISWTIIGIIRGAFS